MGIFKHSYFFIMQMVKMVFYQKISLPLLPINRYTDMSVADIHKELKVFSKFRSNDCGIDVGIYASALPESIAQASGEAGLIIICHSGSARLLHSGVEHSLRARDMVVLFPRDIYSIDAPTADFSASWVSYSKQTVKSLLTEFPTSFFKHISALPITNLADNSEYERSMEYIKLLHSRYTDRENICRANIIENLLTSLFMEVLNRVVKSFEADLSDPKHREYILSQFIDMVSATPRCREVAYFAERLSITPKQLSAIVADGTGYGAKEFIEHNAIAEIKRLLSTTDMQVKQIAACLGFTEAGNMCRFFKSNTGVTISDFRRNSREQ